MPIKSMGEQTIIPQYDLCIVGSGPAGLTFLHEIRELAATGVKIALIESGGLTRSSRTDNLKKVESSGDIRIRHSSRERVWGGTSTTWAGLSSPLDPIDFEQRPYVSSGIHWPFKKNELDPYYSRASAYGFASYERFRFTSLEGVRVQSDLKLPFTELEEKIFIAADPPYNFGKQHPDLLNQENIDVYTDTTVTRLIPDPASKSIESVLIVSATGIQKELRAKLFVICAGGIESVRLLLVSKDSENVSVGNRYDQVGKYIMNHPKGSSGILCLKKPILNASHLFGFLQKGWSTYSGLRLTEDEQRKRRILNSYIRLEPVFPWTDREGLAALIQLTKKTGKLLMWWKRRQKKPVELRDWNETGDDPIRAISFSSLWLIIRDLFVILQYAYYRLSHRPIPVRTIRIRNFMEMEPQRENRITISDGVPHVHMTLSELDKKSLVELHRLFGQEVEASGIGTFESKLGELMSAEKWPITDEASHHLGGAIMGTDPKRSVVDPNLRVHGMSNLYICSGAVFPTSGCANPTYTIVALAVRLADHIREQALALASQNKHIVSKVDGQRQTV